jgi:hypothetical protein
VTENNSRTAAPETADPEAEKGRDKIRGILKDAGLPDFLAEALPESLLKDMAGHEADIRVVKINMDGKRECTHPRVAITDHPETPSPMGENGLGNLDMIFTMLLGWLQNDEMACRQFRRFAMKTARHAAEHQGHDELEIAESIDFFREMVPERMHEIMHWFR